MKLRHWIILSILAAIATILLKGTAYLVTGSVGLFSDALESTVNLVAAATAYISLHYSSRPVDRNHTYGHEKIEFFSSGLEGILIILAAFGTAWVAAQRFIRPAELQDFLLGTVIASVASVINLVVGLLLIREGKKHRSIVLEADGKHLLTDVWTSVGVVAGLIVVWATGINWLDPVIAILVAINICWTGFRLVSRSFDGLMDHALPEQEQETLRTAICNVAPPGTTFHALRTRQAGARRFVDFHLLVEGKKTVREAHDLSLEIEKELHRVLPDLEVTIHLEPIEDRASWEDNALKDIEPPAP
jgi:cation diffusion facilitator family transporter